MNADDAGNRPATEHKALTDSLVCVVLNSGNSGPLRLLHGVSQVSTLLHCEIPALVAREQR